MNEKQSQTATSTSTGIKWGDPISQERQRELRGYIDGWEQETDHNERKGPFYKVKLTGADVFWLAGRACAVVDNVEVHEEARAQLLRARDSVFWQLALDLSRLHLEFADLNGAYLEYAVLNGAHMERADFLSAHLEHASLYKAHAEGASFNSANLEDAHASEAHLEGATFVNARMQRIILVSAHLERAEFMAHLVRRSSSTA